MKDNNDEWLGFVIMALFLLTVILV